MANNLAPLERSLSQNNATSRHDHPLSPSSRPSVGRGASKMSSQAPSYFDGAMYNSTDRDRRRNNATEADLLGIGPSRKLGTVKAASMSRQNIDKTAGSSRGMEMERSRSRKPWRAYLQSLSREELAIVDTDFEAMTDVELESYLKSFTPLASTSTSSYTPRKNDISPSEPSPSAPPSPITHQLANADQSDQPLFPPSPPGSTRPELVDHPLRILSRAIRELKEAVEKLEAENERLRMPEPVLGRSKRNRQADQYSIHEGLAEALSTSLDTDSFGPESRAVVGTTGPRAASLRSSSPTPAINHSKSPAASVKTLPVGASYPAPGPSLYNTKSAESTNNSETSKRHHSNRSSWTAGLWVWSGTAKPKGSRPRKGSGGSVVSQAGTLGNLAETEGDGSGDTELGTDEDAWRKGDGGSTPAFTAIILATRILTPDPASILTPSDRPSTSLVAYLAHALISNARDSGSIIKEPLGRRRSNTAPRSRSRAASSASTESRELPGISDDKPATKGYGDSAFSATATLGRSLFSSVSNATMRAKAYSISGSDHNLPIRPSLLNRASSSRPFPTTALSAGPAGEGSAVNSSSLLESRSDLPSVELSSIVADENRPPTVLLSRQQLGSYFQSSRAVPTLRTASRFNGSEPPLTDRYGFIYDIQHTNMLKDANDAGVAAPSPLNGASNPGESLGEGWIDRQRRKSQERPPSSRRSTSSLDGQRPSPSTTPRRSLDSSSVDVVPSHPRSGTSTPSRDRSSSRPDVHRLRGSSSVSMNPSPPRISTAKDTLTVSARGSSSLQSQVDTTPANTSSSSRSPVSVSLGLPAEHSVAVPNASRSTVSSLLDRLTTLHDSQQKERKKEWDDYLRNRRKAKAKSRDKSGGQEDSVDGGPGLIGVSQMGRGDEWKAFARLVRAGIPLTYRSDVWAECSGAVEMMVPGEYAEIQSVHRDDTSPFIAEIEKDVTRTFPGNVFFGGDGPGVAKLRRVLVAYSWYNPEVGYCQGMNMLAATLLLTHTAEEQAYWTLVSILSRILPSRYYTPDLLSSRADQLVLSDLVAQYVPKVFSHLEGLGVDLSSITFGWFLSLFTDCLPVETLFRVWDVFFVEGHDALFRIAISILKMNEGSITACETVSDLFTFMSTMTSRLWTADKLIAMQHAYKPIIKHAEIRKRCDKRILELGEQADEDL